MSGSITDLYHKPSNCFKTESVIEMVWVLFKYASCFCEKDLPGISIGKTLTYINRCPKNLLVYKLPA